MKWVFIILGSLVALVCLVALVGALLPKKHVASRVATFTRTPASIWQAITDYASYPLWRKDLEKVEILPARDGRPVWREIGKQGATTMEQAEATPPTHMISRIADEKLPYGGRWIYEIEPHENGTRLTITEEGEVYNPIFRFMSRFIFGHATSLEDYLKDLGAKFGESVHPMPGPRNE